ncbi:MAG: hypothetical protein AAF253_07740 [Pseudomonadota bacterium]
MKYKRWRVIAGHGVVNAREAANLLLGAVFLVACGGQDPTPGPEAGAGAPASPPATSENSEATSNGLTLPAVWSTRPLDGPVRDVALAGGARPILAIAFEGRGFQLFDLEGERLGEPIGYGVAQLASGRFADIDGAAVTIFPGISRDGALKAYIYGDNLTAPAEIDLPIETDDAVLGLCAGPPAAAADAIMDLGYWVRGDEATLLSGTLDAEGGTFTWTAAEPITGTSPLAGCRVGVPDASAQAVLGSEKAVATLDRPDGRFAITLDSGGRLLASRPGGGPEEVTLREGLSVRVPVPPVAMDALGTPQDGGYPFGLIVVAGETAPDIHQAVFVDTTPLTGSAGANVSASGE